MDSILSKTDGNHRQFVAKSFLGRSWWSRTLAVILLCSVLAIVVIPMVVISLLPDGPSPLSFKVQRYQTNEAEIVAVVWMQNVSEEIIQYEGDRGSPRVRCAYSTGKTNWVAPPTRASSFLHPSDSTVVEIPLPKPEPVTAGIMIRTLPKLRPPVGRVRLFFTGLWVRIKTMTDYRPCYLPEPLLQPDEVTGDAKP